MRATVGIQNRVWEVPVSVLCSTVLQEKGPQDSAPSPRGRDIPRRTPVQEGRLLLEVSIVGWNPTPEVNPRVGTPHQR